MSDNNEIVWQLRRDKKTGIITPTPRHQTDTVNPLNGIICLREIPDEWHRVKVTDENGNFLVEVFNVEDIKNENQFYVDYTTRKAYFHENLMGHILHLDFYGIGCEYLSCNSIFTKLDENGNVVELLSDIIEKGREYIDAIKIFGTTVDVINELNLAVAEGTAIIDKVVVADTELENVLTRAEAIKDTLLDTSAEAKDLNTSLVNNIQEATSINTTLTTTNTNATTTNTRLTDTNTTATNLNNSLSTAITSGQNVVSQLTSLMSSGNVVVSYNTIADMKRANLKEGQIVFLKGFYKIDDLAQHMRVVGATDNGFGELLDNGLYANLLYQDEVNITHIGARNSYNTDYIIYDVIPYLEKIATKGLIAYFPSGWWALSDYNFSKHSFKIKGCNLQPFFNGENHTENVVSTVLFPYTDGQESVLHYGVKTKEVRGCELSGFQIVTNSMYYDSSNKFVPKYNTGAKCGIDLETVLFSKVHDLIITGTNVNVEYGIKFNGCETFFKSIMYRRFAPIGSNAVYAFHNYHRKADSANGIIAMSVSGMTYEGIDFEGVGCEHFNAVGVDVHFTDSCNELGSIKVASGHTYTSVSFDSIPDNAIINHKGLINVTDCNGYVFDQITIQKIGSSFKHEWTDTDSVVHIEYDVWDRLFTQKSKYLNLVMFTYNNINLQETKKDIDIVGFPDELSYSDSPNKGVISVGNVIIDNNRANIVVRDNMGVSLPCHRRNIPKTNNALSYNGMYTTFMNKVVVPNDSSLQHGIRWDSDKQKEYFARIIGSNTYTAPYQNYLAEFLVDEYLLKGTNNLYFCYFNRLNEAITMDVVFTFKGGTTRTETVSFAGTNNMATKLMKYSFDVTDDKRINKIEFKNCTSNILKIYSVEHRIS